MTQTLHFDEATVVSALSQLADTKASAFAAACANRLSNEVRRLGYAFDSSDLLIGTIDIIWDALDEHHAIAETPEAEILAAMPDEDDEPRFEAAVIEDACAATVYALRSLRSGDPQDAAWAARRAYETVDRHASRFINELEYTESVESQILIHPFVQQELQRQERDLKLISSDGDWKCHLASLKAFASTEAVLDLG